MHELAAFLASPAGLAVKGALVAAFLDFAVGAVMAASKDAFALDSVAAFLRKQVLGRVVPFTILAIAGYATGDLVLNGFASAALVAYAAETIGSIRASLTESKAVAVETIPTE